MDNQLVTAPTFTEARLQQECLLWFNKQYRALSDLLFAIPNGEKRDKITASRLQAQGVKAGVPDMLLAMPQRLCGSIEIYRLGLFIEMKTSEGRLKKEQLRYHEQLQAQGYRVEVVRSLEQFQQLITEYLA